VRDAVRQEVGDGDPDRVSVLGQQGQLVLEVLPAERKPRERPVPGLLEDPLQEAVDRLGVVGCCVANGQSREASAPAFRCARAEIEIIGLTPEALGNADPSRRTRTRPPSRSRRRAPSGAARGRPRISSRWSSAPCQGRNAAAKPGWTAVVSKRTPKPESRSASSFE